MGTNITGPCSLCHKTSLLFVYNGLCGNCIKKNTKAWCWENIVLYHIKHISIRHFVADYWIGVNYQENMIIMKDISKLPGSDTLINIPNEILIKYFSHKAKGLTPVEVAQVRMKISK